MQSNDVSAVFWERVLVTELDTGIWYHLYINIREQNGNV